MLTVESLGRVARKKRNASLVIHISLLLNSTRPRPARANGPALIVDRGERKAIPADGVATESIGRLTN